MDEDSIKKYAKLAVIEYNESTANSRSAKSMWVHFEHLAAQVRQGKENEETQKLITILVSISPEPVSLDEPVRNALSFFLSKVAEDYRLISPDITWPLSPQPKDGSRPTPTMKVVICSDIHLGTNASNRAEFYEWLDGLCNVMVVLLGDILDIWIYGNDLDDDGLVDIVASEWRDLYSHLASAKARGCDIHIVPGNHDAFIYYIEALDNAPWVKKVLNLAPILERVKRATKGSELLSVASLHYPYFKLSIGGKTLLLTHGHYSSWGWRLVAGLDDDALDLDPLLVTVSVAIAHKYTRLLRRVNNEMDWLRRTHLIEDTGISITNAILSAYEGAREMLNKKDDQLLEVIDQATALFFKGKAKASAVEELNLRTALLHMVKHQQEHLHQLQSVRDEHERFLKRNANTSNVDMHRSGDLVRVDRTPLSEYSTFDTFIFGHFHAPRDAEGIYDSGSFVGSQKSYLKVSSDGSVYR